jgi:poly-gamma-glutamate synthesis protein (capsule biosynthesis protein)
MKDKMKVTRWLNLSYLTVIFSVVALQLATVGFLVWEKHGNGVYGIKVQTPESYSANQSDAVIQNLSDTGSKQEEKKSLSLLFFGDLMLDRDIASKIKQEGLAYLFAKIKESDLFQKRDLIACNLEGAVTNGAQHYPPDNSYDFAFLLEIIGQLKNYGFNFFNLANNHIMDQGQRGLNETKQNLDILGFDYSGCPDGQIAECSGKIIQVKNWQIGLVGFSMVYAKLDQETLQKTIKDLADKTDLVIVNMHWGSEYQHRFNQAQQEIAHKLIDLGADVVVGHHPHVVQGIEIYKDKPIFYSLGNFIFDQYFSQDTQQGLAVLVDINADQRHFSLIPLTSKRGQVELMADKGRLGFFSKLISWSELDFDQSQQIKSGEIILAQ